MKKMFLALPLILSFLVLPLAVFAQGKSTQGTSQSGRMSHGSAAMGEKWSGCSDMKAMHDEMSSHMSEMDKRLDDKLSAMNAASGDQKMAAMSDVINEMASQRREMREDFQKMHTARMNCMKGEKHSRMNGPGMKHGSYTEKSGSNAS